ncbi:PACE efflux transporter [Amphritea balenae]|uniref:PACE efflux transporter n=1 Tax=Amphritea balenae TaxID=452629 RepID=A0A3P1SX86_9GAMM|nr:PACE efflux transporter [Amphritea balenae]RRD01595.1 PACE efflux transporter [Amphritea balenae]GGK55681.1 hypothetical protein GCM10007941_02330 [Amphritea balenae]
MSQPIVTRSSMDRIRHTVMFEVFLVMILAPLMSVMLDRGVVELGALAIVLSLKAMLINLLYNYGFDHWDVKQGRIPTQRKLVGRIIHAAGLELVLTATSLPLIIWWLGLTIWQALLMDVVMIAAVMLYTLLFNWVYDRLFPVPQTQPATC